jgi:succinate dehydrogenase / fumarate reductase flavoprotein subunit
VFNTARVEALELDNLVETALRDDDLGRSAQGKPRRARPQRLHERDDVNWLKHTLWYKDGNRLDYKPVK